MDDARPRRPRRLGRAVPGLPRPRAGQRLPALSPEGGDPGSSGGRGSAAVGRSGVRRRRRRGDRRGPGDGAASPCRARNRAACPPIAERDQEMLAYYAARAPEYDDWYLRRGRYTRGPVRDLAWHGELDEVDAVARRPADRRARSWSWRPAPAGGRRCWRRRASSRSTTRCPNRWTWRGSGWSRTTCGRTSTSATRGTSPIARSTRCSAASGSATFARDRLRRLPGARRTLAQARRHLRVHRLAPGSRLGRRRPRSGGRRRHLPAPPRRRARVPDPEGLLLAVGPARRAAQRRVRRGRPSRRRRASS